MTALSTFVDLCIYQFLTQKWSLSEIFELYFCLALLFNFEKCLIFPVFPGREAACRPASGSLIAEMFDPSTRGVANGIFSWGVYIGYGLTFVLGNNLGKMDIFGYNGWRAAFVVGCSPGIIIAFFLFFLEDPRQNVAALEGEQQKMSADKNYGTANGAKKIRKRSLVLRQEKSYFKTVLNSLLQPTMVLLFVATSVRHTGR